MPWYNYRPYRTYRRKWRRYWRRPRGTFRRQWWRRRRVRRRFYRKKLKKLKLTQFQPHCIRKCKIKGPICLFQCTNQRLINDFDLYELSQVPPHLPGGGGWGIKRFTLESLFSEHVYARNVWTKTNRELPLVRYTGCKIKLYQSQYTDYVFTYSTDQPMQSSLAMYNSMQPSIHSMTKNKIIMPSLETYRRKKPYKTIHIKPPPQLQNKWYFQNEFSKTPLLLTRTSAMSLNKFYIDPDKISTNMDIISLNASVFQNRNFKSPPFTTGYWAKKTLDKTFYLYATNEEYPKNGLSIQHLIPLTDSKNFEAGKNFLMVYPSGQSAQWSQWQTTTYKSNLGNPFYPDYLQGTYMVVLIPKDPNQLFNQEMTAKETTYTPVELTQTLRYNPYSDQGNTNMCYFKSNSKEEINWQPPENPELYNENLPFWLLLWGFSDWHKKIKKHLHLETDYILCMTHEPASHQKEYIIPISQSFYEGRSPYETKEGPSKADAISWYPQLQYQNEILNDICRAGPGVTRIPDNYSVQAYMVYEFYFKWGGNPPQMSTIDDPIKQPSYVIPSNLYTTPSLQNPTGDPSKLLYAFDQRRGQITSTALQRIQKDSTTKRHFITDGTHFEQVQTGETTPETSSSEEEETPLYEQLQQQRQQQLKLRQRIMKTLKKLQLLE
nr:MAG: ORF1 [TTV-like mini virus]